MKKWFAILYLGFVVLLGSDQVNGMKRALASTDIVNSVKKTFTLYQYASLPAKVVVLDKHSTFYRLKISLASSEPLTCFYNDEAFTLDNEKIWELKPANEVKIACQIDPAISKTRKAQLHVQYEMISIQDIQVTNPEAERWQNLKKNFLEILETTNADKLSKQLLNNTYLSTEELQQFYEHITVNVDAKVALKEIRAIQKDDVIHFYNPSAETYNPNVKSTEDNWGFNYQGDDEDKKLKQTFLEPQLINAVMVCGLSGANISLPLTQKIFVGSKQDFSLSTNHTGKLGCRINGEKHLLTKRSGSGRIYLEIIKKDPWLKYVDNKIEELARAQNLVTQSQTEHDARNQKEFLDDIQKLVVVNKKMIAMEPVTFCEQKVPDRTLKYKTSVASSILYGAETRSHVGRSCGDPVFDEQQNAFFVCAQCATPVTDTLCPGKTKDGFLVKLNGQATTEQVKFQSQKFELKDVGNRADFYSPLRIENTLYITGNNAHVYVMDLDGKILEHHNFGEFRDAGAFVQVEDLAMVLVEQGKENEPAFGAFLDHQGQVVHRFPLNVKMPTHPLYVQNKIIYADFYGSEIFILDNTGKLLKTLNLQKFSRRDQIEIRSLSFVQNKLYAGDGRGQLFEVNLENSQPRLFFSVPAIAENHSLELNYPIKQLKTKEILVVSNNRAYVLSPLGKLQRIFGKAHHIITGTPSLIQHQNEEMIWLVRTSEIALYDVLGRNLMSYETSFNENTQGLFNFLTPDGFLSPMRDGMRFFRFFEIEELTNEASYFVPCAK
ncbi:MAG: hypothetical protein JNM93_05740 [Bacteriovoracaceae bacterium]|nr:hypothetical protein [Bacteriovoracaceae bacterium]